MDTRLEKYLELPFKHYTPRKEHPDWEALNREAFILAKSILKHLTILDARQKLKLRKRRFLAIIKTFKNLVKNKIKMARGDHDFIPLFYIWTMTNACNFTCTYCSNHRGGKYPDLFKEGRTKTLTTEQGKQLIKVMQDASAIYYCGGEPTLRKDLPELLEYSTKLNMFNMINTNGSLIGNLLLKPAYKNFLMHMDVLIISLDSLIPSKLASLYNVKETFAKNILRNILLLRILREFVPFKLTANTVITNETIHDSFDILDWCNDLGLTFSPVAMNHGCNPDLELVRDPTYLELVDAILDRSRNGYPMIASTTMLDRLLHAKLERCYPAVFDHVDNDGGVYWPCKSYPGAVKINALAWNNVKEVHAAGSKLINPTHFHGKGAGKCNGNCAWMQDCVTEFYGNALVEGFFDGGLFKEIGGLLR